QTFAFISLNASILANRGYNYGRKVITQAFDPILALMMFGTMAGYGESDPLQGASPATTDEMTALQLQILGINLRARKPEYLILDQNNLSRNNKTVMGADISIK